MKRLNFIFPQELVDLLDKMARERMCDRSDFIRQLLFDVSRTSGKFPTEIQAECREEMASFRKRLEALEAKVK
ncbi:MAG: ribbon-helix-helix protein, CopG family [Planctomycetia bacterium]|nr:ribbon-helix-helix protein, CopG family [Planctomycetia bacterium]